MKSKNMIEKDWIWGEEAKARISPNILKIMDELVDYWEKVSSVCLQKNKIKIVNKKCNYSFCLDIERKDIWIYTIEIPKAKIWEGDERDRNISFSVRYWKDCVEPEYKGMFSIGIEICTGKHLLYDIWVLEYLYRNNRELFNKLFHGRESRLRKQSLGTEVKYYLWLYFYENELDYVKYVIKEIMEWILNIREIIEALEGKKSIEGYEPPTPL